MAEILPPSNGFLDVIERMNYAFNSNFAYEELPQDEEDRRKM